MAKKESVAVVSNTGPLISLIKIKQLQLLWEMYGAFLISTQVYSEISTRDQRDYINHFISRGMIKKITAPKLNVLHDLDLGEASSISLALQYEKSLLIADDIEAREFAKYVGLEVTGTLGILLLAKKLKLIRSIKEHLEKLESQGRWFSRKLIQQVLKEAKEL